MEDFIDESAWDEVGAITSKGKTASFWKAIEIWLQKPHVVNRRLCGTAVLYRTILPYGVALTFLRQERILLVCESLTKESLETNHLLCPRSYDGQKQSENDDDVTCSNHGNGRDVEFCIRKLLPKQLDRNQAINECVILDKTLKVATFLSFQKSKPDVESIPSIVYAYKISFIESDDDNSCARVQLCVHDNKQEFINGVTNPTSCWLLQQLIPKLVRWMEVSDPSTPVSNKSVLDIEKYTTLYQQLKQKYGPDMIRVWPENTDPQKFVFEDIAIATYLLLLWEQEREEKQLSKRQSFVDLGCGNGLLVHLLNSEGHPGKGIDVRKRKIWDLYGSNTHLEETTITPSDTSLFPDYDWLIGNHSDELTPWIPVIAARSSFNNRYFVLPCCFHDFNGKFKRTNAGLPQYRTYLNYIMDIGKVCGFQVIEDTMRIPSTKRVCQIGSIRTYNIEEHRHVESRIQEFISQRCQQGLSSAHLMKSLGSKHCHPGHVSCDSQENRCREDCKDVSPDYHVTHDCQDMSPDRHVTHDSEHCPSESSDIDVVSKLCDKMESLDTVGIQKQTNDSGLGASSTASWVENFQPRSQTEVVRNCSAVDYALRDHITNTIANTLIELRGREDKIEVKWEDGNTIYWNKGGKLPLPQVAAMFDHSILGQLKNECGGLQTLLRNSHQVFQVIGGVVQLRDWSRKEPIRKHKTKAGKGKTNNPMKSHSTVAKDPVRLHKTKLCWFYSNHPDSCPRSAETCQFAHGENELRERPSFDK
ncbi:putative tRNA (uracil-O(2)-)-methyltransferase [Glandiceps talaboti]